MPGVSVSIEGDAELQRLLESTGTKLYGVIKDAVSEAALELENVAKQLAPVDTGRMRASIGQRAVGSDGLAVDVVVRTEYAEAVEYGTEASPAQPFMTPARENVASGFGDIVTKHAKRVTG